MEESNIYSKDVIEFVTVVAETCLFLENCHENNKEDFVLKATKLFPLLYLKTTILCDNKADAEEDIERFVSEDDYTLTKNQIEALLGEDDIFLETFHPDMPYSDTPIAVFISENLADIYQELKDFAANYQIGETSIMENALNVCLQTFSEHWGQKLLGALRALHAIRFSDDFGNYDEDKYLDANGFNKIDRDSFLRFQRNDDDEV